MSARSTPRPMIQRRSKRAPKLPGAAGAVWARDAIARSNEVVLIGGFVPDDLALVLERERGHVAGNGGLLAHGRWSDRGLVAADRFDEVAEVVDGAVRLVEIGLAVEVDGAINHFR